MDDLMRERLGVFRGFGESRYEVVSDVLIPYRERRHVPLQGGYLVVSVEDFDGKRCGVLGRVIRAYPIGDLLGSAGEDYLVDLMRLDQEVPEAVRVSRLRYRVSLRLLGQVTVEADGCVRFTPSLRMTPHVGAPVGLPSDKVLRILASGVAQEGEPIGAHIGYLAIGDLAFDGSRRVNGRCFPVHLRMNSLVGRRSAVFARAGMGKSNFVKVLLSRLYQDPSQSVGTIVIDPEGEYAMSNASEPGLLDLPSLAGRVLLFTDRKDIAPEYRESIGGRCRINFKDLSPQEVVANAIPEEKQDAVFANTLRGLDRSAWTCLVDLLAKDRFRTNPNDVASIIQRRIKGADGEDVICGAIINNVVPVLQRLHDSESTLFEHTFEHLRRGGIVILDVSMLSSTDAQRLSGWLLHKVFANNQLHYTTAREDQNLQRPLLIPTLAVLEEAQYYLGSREAREDSPFVRWFKEGRKYQLGSVIVTQQPGAVPVELISQCDNFFVFHLLSGVDLDALGRANFHYSSDILNMIASEPIPGNCYLWSSRGLSVVTCARILSFSQLVAEDQNKAREGMPSEQVAQDVAPNAVSAMPVPSSTAHANQARDAIEILAQVVEEVLHFGSGLAIRPVRSRKLLKAGASDADYPPAEKLVVINAYNLRFQVADEIEKRYPESEENVGLREQLLEGFAERRIVKEPKLQRVLCERGYSPPALIARAKNPAKNKDEDFFVLLRDRLKSSARIRKEDGLDVSIMPMGGQTSESDRK